LRVWCMTSFLPRFDRDQWTTFAKLHRRLENLFAEFLPIPTPSSCNTSAGMSLLFTSAQCLVNFGRRPAAGRLVPVTKGAASSDLLISFG